MSGSSPNHGWRVFWLAVIVGALTYFLVMALAPSSSSTPRPLKTATASAFCDVPACYVPGLGTYIRYVNGAKIRYCDDNYIRPPNANLTTTYYIACLISNERQTHAGRACLIAAGITTGGIVVGGLIGGATAKAIAGGIVGGSGAACISKIVDG